MIQVEIQPFSGPMDLLLELLQQAKIDIYDIEISLITERFLAVMQNSAIPAEELSDFIRMASILVQMKVRMLVQDRDEDDEVISREEMIRRLLEYRTFKELSSRLASLEEEGFGIFSKLGEDPARYQSKPQEVLSGTKEDLFDALRSLRERRNSRRFTFSPQAVMVREEYSEDVVARRIRNKLAKGERFTFLDLFDAKDVKKGNVIVTFLLLLELSRRHALQLMQKPGSKEIAIRMQNRDTFNQVLNGIDPSSVQEDTDALSETEAQ